MLSRKNVYLYHKKTEQMAEKVKPFYENAPKYGFTVVDDYRKANIILSFGSDGDFLQAVRKTNFRDDCLYLGIGVEDRPHFYCDFYIGDSEKLIKAVSGEDIEVRRYPTIEVKIDNDFSFHCLNEFSIKSSIISTFVMDIFIDGSYFETFRGDGMIVSTPTGSTGYAKSVGGALIDPLIPSLQVAELASINNNRYRTLGSPFILSGERELTLTIVQTGNNYPIMGMDNEALSIQHVDHVNIKLSSRRIKTIKMKDNSFWEKVKRNFL